VITATPDQQRRLLDLQAVDTQVRQLRHRRANLPEQQALDEQEATLGAVAREFTANRDELSKVELNQRRLEQEIATVDSRRKSEEGRMYSGLITSEKEVEALRHELSSLRARKSDLEDVLLEAMERREELEGMVATLKARHGELEAELPARTTARDEAATEIDAELGERTSARSELAGQLPDAVTAHYEDLRRRKQGLAIVALSGRTCLGCRLELTASEMEEAKRDSARYLPLCPQCGRGVVVT
jgi:predicted  nucleic acid-binding Zn-ribbon protein